jgi:hypothetical protein
VLIGQIIAFCGTAARFLSGVVPKIFRTQKKRFAPNRQDPGSYDHTFCVASLLLTQHTVVILFSDNGGLAKVTDNALLRSGKGYLYEGGIRVPLIVK